MGIIPSHQERDDSKTRPTHVPSRPTTPLSSLFAAPMGRIPALGLGGRVALQPRRPAYRRAARLCRSRQVNRFLAQEHTARSKFNHSLGGYVMLNRIVKWLVLSALIVVALSIAAPLIVRADPVPPDLVQALVDQTGGQVQIEYHRQTGQVRFIGTDPARPIPHAADLRAEAAPEEAARSFLGA